jgi:regulator of protease activity HflC (stomatin/prohibitin superfamily)
MAYVPRAALSGILVYIAIKIFRVGEMVRGTVQQVDRGNIYVKLDRSEAILPPREQIARETFELVKKMTSGRGVIVESVLLRKIGLPAVVANAIQEKLRREQEAEAAREKLATMQEAHGTHA